jgi:large subunit ribosomal protein L25
MATLQIRKREKTGKQVKKLRKDGELPAVLYGPKEKAVSISMALSDFLRVFKNAGESTVISLVGLDDEKEALVQDVDVDPVSGIPRHVDFYAIEKGKKVTVDVPLEFIGVSSAVKELGGSLVKVLHEIEVEAMPKDLPHSIEVNIEPLKDFESQVLAKELVLPAGVTLMTGPEEVVALVSEAVEEPEEPVATPDLESIEVEKKGKESEEESSGEEQAA